MVSRAPLDPSVAPVIRQLSETAAARIAAGEVIERPASIVKELLENALDAGASRIDVEVAGGGLDLIRVGDDGQGIDPEQLELAFSRHATSKLSSDDDLFAISTLGFRGEALPSIAAVSEVELVSRPPWTDAGAAVAFRYGVYHRKKGSAAAPGTTVTVRRLFQRQPTRLKFLRSRAAEYQAISAVVEHYALARHEVSFWLSIDGRPAFHSAAAGDRRQVLAAVHGPEVARRLIEIPPYNDRGVEVSGWIAPPDLTKSTRQGLSLFVNGRWVQNRRLLFALSDAFQGLLPRGRHPIAVVALSVSPQDVDVNVHPTKAEVRFRDEGAVFGVLQRALRAALSEFAPVPAFAEHWEAPGLPLQPPRMEFVQRGEQPALPLPTIPGDGTGQEQPPPARSRLPLLRVLGQMGGTYVVAEGPDGMYLLDQHAAHERVLYERLAHGGERGPDVQALLEPRAVDLSPPQIAALEDFGGEMLGAGFQVQPMDGASYLLRALPAGLVAADPAKALTEFLDALSTETGGERAWRINATLACHASVRAGMTMENTEMRALVNQLEACAEPMACPHGRPTLVHLPVDVLDRQFGRNWR